MTAKEYLSQYKHLDAEIKLKEEQKKRLEELAASISTGNNPRRTGVSDKVGWTVAKLVDAENEIRNMINSLIALKSNIEKTIEAVEDIKLRQILTLRYINGHTFEQIAEEMDYSLRQVLRKHKAALKNFENVIECHIEHVVLLR